MDPNGISGNFDATLRFNVILWDPDENFWILWEFTELGWNFSNWEGIEWDFHELYGFLWNVGAF